MWRFDRLKPEDHQLLLEAWTTDDYPTLIRIYQERQVPPTPLGGCCAYGLVRDWTNYAIDQNIIQWTTPPTTEDTNTG